MTTSRDSVIYTDGHEVKVTTQQFIVGKAQYLISGIINARMLLIKSSRLLPITLVLIGLAAIVTGLLHFYGTSDTNVFYVASFIVTPNRIAVFIGGVLIFLGLIWLMAMQDRYAVHIMTAEGGKDPIVSRRRDYIQQIVAALDQAITWRQSTAYVE